MNKSFYIILTHQIIFQSMFLLKNIYLHRKTKIQIRGKNKEAVLSIIFFVFFIASSIILSLLDSSPGSIHLVGNSVSIIIAILLLILNLIISAASLINMRDSWRVGILENQKTELVTSGIYSITRNPYFVSYFIMFIAYTVILQNLILMGFSIIGIAFVHKMILKEEEYLSSVHGDEYFLYKKKIPRYLII
jgi:protein-S-isoprenylcysteine O-methyltransferase Ste14